MEYQGRTHFNCTKKISNVLVNPVIVLLVSLHSDFNGENNKKNTPPKKYELENTKYKQYQKQKLTITSETTIQINKN